MANVYDRNQTAVQRLAYLRDEIDRIKTNQLSGLDVNPVFETDTGNAVDYTWETPINANDFINLWFKFTADNQEKPFVKLVLDLKNKTTGDHLDKDKVLITIQDQTQLSKKAHGGITDKDVVIHARIASDTWQRTPNPPQITDDVQIKGFAFATDIGTLTYHSSLP